MNVNLAHYQTTTLNEIGIKRRSKFSHLWTELELAPTYVHSANDNKESEYSFFSDTLNRHMTGLSGCLKSHRTAWKLFLESENKYALITEDDAIPLPKIKSELTKILSSFDNFSFADSLVAKARTDCAKRPTYIQLGWYTYPRLSFRQFIVAGHHLLRYRGPVRSGYVRGHGFANHCYLINREMAVFLLDKLSSEGLPLDLQLMALANHKAYSECRIFRSCRNFAVQEGLDSSIHSGVTPTLNTPIKRILVWVQSLADAKGTRFTI